MTDNEATVAVPVSLIERLHAESVMGAGNRAALAALLPKSAPHRLRVVDLDAIGPRYIANDGKHMVWVEDLDTAPDVLDVDSLAQIIRRVDGNHDLGAGALAEAIRTAIEEAVDRG